jgi:hypothetical protein
MKSLIFIFLLFSACATPGLNQEAHDLTGWYLIYNADTYKLCGKPGCTIGKVIYCYKGDYIVCGHELRHVTDGDFHKKN